MAEEPDGTSLASVTDSPAEDSRLFGQLRDASVAMIAAAGGNWHYGRLLYGDMCDQGLVEVEVEGRIHLAHGGSPIAEYWRLNIEHGRGPLIRFGCLSEQQIEDTCQLLAKPDFAFTTNTIWAV